MSEYSKAYYQANKEKWPAYINKWRAANPEKVKEISISSYKKWSRENPDKIREIDRKKRSTAKGKLSDNVSRAIRKSLGLGVKNGRHWEGMVGYSIDQLKAHLEKKFKAGMNWKNFGSYWNIDHKIPVVAFNFNAPGDLDFKRCWALENLQPLEARINFSKGAKLQCPFQPGLTL